MHEDRICRSCGMTGGLEPVRVEDRFWTHGDRKLLVAAYRCIGCASIEANRRDFDRKNEKTKTAPGSMAPGDGLRMTVDDYHEGR